MAGTYLETNPPIRSQFRNPRREDPSGVIIVHDAESVPDIDPPDTGAEGVANYIRVRTTPGSYHDIVDSDSILRLLPYEWEAFQDGTGSNPHGYAVGGAYRIDQWAGLPQAWKDACVYRMAVACADYAKWIKAEHGVVIPAKRITRDESERRVPGFISHAERDPGRRSDPGPDFPWDQFLAHFSQLTAPTAPPTDPPEDDMFPGFIIDTKQTTPEFSTPPRLIAFGGCSALTPAEVLMFGAQRCPMLSDLTVKGYAGIVAHALEVQGRSEDAAKYHKVHAGG